MNLPIISQATNDVVFKKASKTQTYLLDLTTRGHTWAHREALPVSCQWFGSGPVSGWTGTSHRARRRSTKNHRTMKNVTQRRRNVTAPLNTSADLSRWFTLPSMMADRDK